MAQPSWFGYSVGKWEGDTFVVETVGFNDKTRLMDVEMTFDDPLMYTKPFTIKFTEELLADADIFEFYCNENEKDRAHLGQK